MTKYPALDPINFETYRDKCKTLEQQVLKALGFDTQLAAAKVAGVDKATIGRLLKGETSHGITDSLGRSFSLGISRSSSSIKFKDAAELLTDNLYYVWRHNLMWYKRVERHTIPTNFKLKINSETVEKFSLENRVNVIERWHSKYLTNTVKYSTPLKKISTLPKRFDTYQQQKEYIQEELVYKWSMPFIFELYNRIETEVKTNLGIILDFFDKATQNNHYEDVEHFFWALSYALYLCGEAEQIKSLSEWLVTDARNHISPSSYYFAQACIIWIKSASPLAIDVRRSHDQISELWHELSQSDLLNKLDPRVIAMICELVLRIQNRLYIQKNETYSHRSFKELYEQSHQVLTSILGNQKSESISDDMVERFKIPLDYQLALNLCIRGCREDSDKFLNMALDIYDNLFTRATNLGWQRLSHALLTWKAAIVAKNQPEVSRSMLLNETALITRRDHIRAKIFKGYRKRRFLPFLIFLRLFQTAKYKEANVVPEILEEKYPSVYIIIDRIMKGSHAANDPKYSTQKIETERVTVKEVFITRKLKERLDHTRASLQSWNARYDYALWARVEEHFNEIWTELESLLYLCIEYDLYDELRKIFIELRNFLHITGRSKERLYFASWLFKESRRRNDQETELFALSTIVWSHTCTGYYQDIEKAAQLWEFLMSRMLNHDVEIQPSGKKINTIVQDSTDGPISPELFLEAYESGVRIYIRQEKLDLAWLQTSKFDELINDLSRKNLISSRLKIRCQAAKSYHRGIIYYLRKDFDAARETFQSVYKKATAIRWERVQRGSQSWLATVAKEQHEFQECNDILSKAGVFDAIHEHNASKDNIQKKPRDAVFHLIKADLAEKNGHMIIKRRHQKEANRIFVEYSSCNQSKTASLKLLTPQ